MMNNLIGQGIYLNCVKKEIEGKTIRDLESQVRSYEGKNFFRKSKEDIVRYNIAQSILKERQGGQ